MSSPGDARYIDKRGKNLDKLYQIAASKKTFVLQKLILLLRRIILFLSRTRVVGRENLPAGGCIIAASHFHYLDPFWAGMAYGKAPLRFSGKSQVFRFPFTKMLLVLGVFPVRRGTSDPLSFKTALQILANGHKIIIFPQGGTKKRLKRAKLVGEPATLRKKHPARSFQREYFMKKELAELLFLAKRPLLQAKKSRQKKRILP